MQTHGGAAAEAAILGAERVFRAKVRVDWNNNGLFDHELSNLDPYIENISVDRALTGSAPEEILLIEGSSSAELKLSIHGEHKGLSLMATFSPYNAKSIFSGIQTINCELKYDLLVDTPLGTFTYPQFVGNVRTITPNRADGVVEIVALDRAEKLRKPIQLPPFAISEEHISYGEQDSQYIRPQWVIDNALRLCDTGVTGKRPTTRLELGLANDSLDGCLVWVTGNGSYLPTIGYLDNLNIDSFANAGTAMYSFNGPLHPDVPADTPRPLNLAGLGLPITHEYYKPSHQGLIRYWVADQDRLNPQAVHYFGGTLSLQGNDTALGSIGKYMLFEIIIGWTRCIRVWIQNGQIWMTRHRPFDGNANPPSDTSNIEATTAKVNIPTTGTHADVFLMWDITPGVSRAYIRAGNNVLSSGWTNVGSAITQASDVGTDQIKGRFTIGQGIGISDAYYGTSNQTGKPVNDQVQMWTKPKYPAILDEGLNRFSYTPSAKRQEAWQLVQDVAAAEFGSVFWDETGTFRFWNWETMLAKRDNVVRTLSLDQVENLVLSNNSDSVRNVYSVNTTKRRSSRGTVEVFKAQDIMEFYTPARTTSRFTLWMDNIVSPLTFVMPRYSSHTNTHGLGVWNNDNEPSYGYVVQFYFPGQSDEWREADEYQGPRITAYFSSGGYVTLKVENKTDRDIRLGQGWDDGGVDEQPRLKLHGTKIFESTNLALEFINEESVNKYGERTLDLQGDWYQDALWTTRLLEVVSARTAEPVPTTDAITIAGDPRLQLGDVIKVVDDDGFGDMQLQIFGISRTFALDTGLTDTLSVEMVPPPGPPPTTDPTEPPRQTISRVNICDNPSLKFDDDGWWGGSRVTGQTGMTRSTGISVGSGGSGVGPKVRVDRDKVYRFSAEIKGSGGTVTGTIQIDWYSNWGYLATSGGASFSSGSSSGTRAYTGAAAAPRGATRAVVVVRPSNRTAIIGSVLYEQTSDQRSYFDGDTPGAQWDGAAGNSSSRITQEI